MTPIVSIIMGSTSDLPVMEKAAQLLNDLHVPFEMNALSAHRTPEAVEEFAKNAHSRGIKVIIAAAGIWGALGPFWAFAGSFLSGTGAAGGFALINSIGNLGGFTGPWLMGFFRDSTGSYTTGMTSLGLIIFAGGIMAWLLKFCQRGR